MFNIFKKNNNQSSNEIINYISKYRVNVDILNDDNCEISNNDWKEIFNEKDKKKRIEMTIELWRKYCGEELRNTILCLIDNLVNVEFIKSEKGISVIYEIKDNNGELEYFEGFLPKKNYQVESFENYPLSLKKFYQNLHNGFSEIMSSVGILPTQLIEKMSDYEWGIIEDLNLDVKISLENSYMIFSSGGGGYIVIDASNNNDDEATIWFSKNEPIYNVKIWDYIDEWLLMVLGY